MENQDIILDSEVMDVTEHASSGSGLGWKLGLGALAVAGLIWGGKKLRNKRKSKKTDGVVVKAGPSEKDDVEVIVVED